MIHPQFLLFLVFDSFLSIFIQSLLTVCPLFSIFPQFSIFPPSSFSPVFFSICCKLKIVPKKAITVVKSLHITVGLYRGATLCLSITTYNCLHTKLHTEILKSTNKYSNVSTSTDLCRATLQVPESSQKYLEVPDCGQSHLPGALLP